MSVLVVPFRRPLKLNDRGTDVVAVKRALSRAGFMQWGKFTNVYGKFAVNAVKQFQKTAGLKVNGVYDEATHRALLRTHRKVDRSEWAFDSRAVWLMGQQPAPRETDDSPAAVRARIKAAALLAYAERDRIIYTQRRPMVDMAFPPNVPNDMDCSTLATWCYRAAGADDPNGRRYDGWGYTGTQQSHGRVVSFEQAEVGDLIFYPSPWHVAIYVGSGRAISHGSSSGPKLHAWNYRQVHSIRSYF